MENTIIEASKKSHTTVILRSEATKNLAFSLKYKNKILRFAQNDNRQPIFQMSFISRNNATNRVGESVQHNHASIISFPKEQKNCLPVQYCMNGAVFLYWKQNIGKIPPIPASGLFHK